MSTQFHVARWGGYPWYVLLCVGATAAQTISYCEEIGWKLTRREQRELAGPSAAKTLMLDSANTIVMLDKWEGSPDDVGALCHEAFHAVWRLMDHIGVRPSDDSEEAFAYALDDIIARLMGALASATP